MRNLTEEEEKTLALESCRIIWECSFDLFCQSEEIDSRMDLQPVNNAYIDTKQYPEWFQKVYAIRGELKGLQVELCEKFGFDEKSFW